MFLTLESVDFNVEESPFSESILTTPPISLSVYGQSRWLIRFLTRRKPLNLRLYLT